MTDVVVHAEVVRAQEQLAQLQADIAAARQAIADVQVAALGSVVNRVLRGVAGGAAEVFVTIPEVRPEKCVLSLLRIEGGGTLGVWFQSIEFTSSTQLKIAMARGSNPNYYDVKWQLVEYR